MNVKYDFILKTIFKLKAESILFETKMLEAMIELKQFKDENNNLRNTVRKRNTTIECHRKRINELQVNVNASNIIAKVFETYYFRFLKYKNIKKDTDYLEDGTVPLCSDGIADLFIECKNRCLLCFDDKCNIMLVCGHKYCFTCFTLLGSRLKGICPVCTKPIIGLVTCTYDRADNHTLPVALNHNSREA